MCAINDQVMLCNTVTKSEIMCQYTGDRKMRDSICVGSCVSWSDSNRKCHHQSAITNNSNESDVRSEDRPVNQCTTHYV